LATFSEGHLASELDRPTTCERVVAAPDRELPVLPNEVVPSGWNLSTRRRSAPCCAARRSSRRATSSASPPPRRALRRRSCVATA